MTTRDELVNIIRKHAHEEYDNIIADPYYWLDGFDIAHIVDDMLKSEHIKDNQVYQVQEYDYDENKKKIGFTCPACSFKFGINKLYQYCPKCGARIKGWRQ
jgi:rubrerythrin